MPLRPLPKEKEWRRYGAARGSVRGRGGKAGAAAYLEGQTLQEGPVVEKITTDGVILNRSGLRYMLPKTVTASVSTYSFIAGCLLVCAFRPSHSFSLCVAWR